MAGLATAVFAIVALWEIGAPFGAGHFAASCAVTLGGENMLRFHTLVPITSLPLSFPTNADCYCHHPFGIFWTAAAFVSAFGHHDFVCRLPAVLLSALTPPLLYAFGRALWSPLAGALAALGFVFTPIALSFANFNSLEVPLMASVLAASLAYVRFRQTLQCRWLLLTLLSTGFALNTDWPAYIFAAGLLALVFARTFLFGGRLSALEHRRHSQLFAWGVLLVASIAAGYLLALTQLGQLRDLLDQGQLRSSGWARPLAETLAARRYWILLMFTPLSIIVGKLGVALFPLRVWITKSELELVPLLVLAMALFQYLAFPQGADIHVFWPHCFALYFALALGALGDTLALSLRSLSRRFELEASFPGLPLPVHRLTAFALAALVPLAMARDAFTTLVYARKTGGRFNEKGSFIQPDKDKVAALAFLAEHSAKDAVVVLDPNMRKSLWVPWVLKRPTQVSSAIQRTGKERYYVIDSRLASDATLRPLAKQWSLTAIGPFWIFDRGTRFDPAQGYSIVKSEPHGFERFFVSSTHSLREVKPDPYWTWEVRDHVQQTPNPEPEQAPETLEQLRIAHNIAVQQGNLAPAADLRDKLLRAIDTRPKTIYEDGSELLGMRFESGASDVLTLYFASSGAADQRFSIRSRVEAAEVASLVPRDTLEWEVGLPSALPRAIWKRGYLYSSVTEILRRPGRERFVGSWLNTGRELPLKAKDGSTETTLLVLP